jgi:heme O synthase-like polyprenyltransferase
MAEKRLAALAVSRTRGLGPTEYLMITFILLAVFAIIGIAFFVVAYTSNQRRRAGQSGIDSVNNQQVRHPRATPPSQ